MDAMSASDSTTGVSFFSCVFGDNVALSKVWRSSAGGGKRHVQRFTVVMPYQSCQRRPRRSRRTSQHFDASVGRPEKDLRFLARDPANPGLRASLVMSVERQR